MTSETNHWHENRAEVERIDVYRKNRVSHAADMWTVDDCWKDLNSIHAGRWAPETRELLSAARDAVAALHRAMVVEV